MSVFKKVVGRVRDFFLEPDAKTPVAKPVATSGVPAPRPVPKSVEKPDAFEWEPPEKWRAEAETSAPAGARPSQRPPSFSARNFSTEELQRSSVLDIVEGLGQAERPAVASPGLSNDLL